MVVGRSYSWGLNHRWKQKWATFPLKVCIFFNNKVKQMVAVSSTHRHGLTVKKQCFGNISGPEWKCPCWVPRKCLCWGAGTLVPRPFSAFPCSEVWASFPEAAHSAMHGSHQCNSQGWHAAGFPCFDFWMDSTFLSSTSSSFRFFSDWPKMGADVVNTCWKSLNIIFTPKKSLTQAVSDCVNSWLHSGLLMLLLLPEITDSRERPWEVNHRLT